MFFPPIMSCIHQNVKHTCSINIVRRHYNKLLEFKWLPMVQVPLQSDFIQPVVKVMSFVYTCMLPKSWWIKEASVCGAATFFFLLSLLLFLTRSLQIQIQLQHSRSSWSSCFILYREAGCRLSVECIRSYIQNITRGFASRRRDLNQANVNGLK